MNSDQQTDGAGMIEFLAWLEVNKKRVAIGALLVLAVGFGIYVYNYMGEQKELQASAALIELRPGASANTNEPPVPASAFLKVAEQHSGTEAAERALLLAGGALFTDGKYSEAQAQFDRLLKEHADSKWAADALYGTAASLEAQGKRDEALSTYERVAKSYASSAVANEAKMAAARIYEAKNQPADALRNYDDVAGRGMSMRAQEAMMARMQLLKKHPELDKSSATNAMMSATLPVGTNKTAATPTNAPMTNKPASATNTAAGAQK